LRIRETNLQYVILKDMMKILNTYTVKKRLPVFPSPARMSLTKVSLARNNLIFGPGRVW
jgi:hypothetical protein